MTFAMTCDNINACYLLYLYTILNGILSQQVNDNTKHYMPAYVSYLCVVSPMWKPILS